MAHFVGKYVTGLRVVFDRFSLLKFVFLQRYITKFQQLCVFRLSVSAFWLCPAGKLHSMITLLGNVFVPSLGFQWVLLLWFKLREQLFYLRFNGSKVACTFNDKYYKLKQGMITTKTGLFDYLNKNIYHVVNFTMRNRHYV